MVMGRTLFVVEDQEVMVRAWTRAARRAFQVVAAGTVTQAKSQLPGLDPEHLAGAVIDVGLPDGSGLDLIAEFRARFPHVPVVVFTGRELDPEVVARAGIVVFSKLDPAVTIPDVINHLANRAAPPRLTMEQGLDLVVRSYAFTPPDAQILRAAASGIPRAALSAELGISPNTLKSRLRRLGKKTGLRTLAAIRLKLLQVLHQGSNALADEMHPPRVRTRRK